MSLARIFQSSMTKSAYSVRLANQRDFQSVVTPSLNPYGLTFCPIYFSSPSSPSATSSSVLDSTCSAVRLRRSGCHRRSCSAWRTRSFRSRRPQPRWPRSVRPRSRRPLRLLRSSPRSVRAGISSAAVSSVSSTPWAAALGGAGTVGAGATPSAGPSGRGRCVPGLLVLPAPQGVVVEPAHDDRDVTGALADAGGPTAGPRPPPLEGRPLVGVAGRHVQGLGVLLVVGAGVGHRRGEALADDDRRVPLENCRMASASATCLRMRSSTSRTLLADMPSSAPAPGCRAARWS